MNKINVTTLEQVAQLDEHNLAKLHGMGPKAIGILKEALLEQGLAFSQLDDDLKNVKFTVLGDLKCDNAPKEELSEILSLLHSLEMKSISMNG